MSDKGTNSAGAGAAPEPAPGGGPAWELLLTGGAAAPRQRGRQLQRRLREAVRAGVLAPGTRLPPSRELARDLAVSRGLVTEAYEQLTAEGYLVSRPGAGTWVSDAARPAAAAVPPEPATGAGAGGAPVVDFRPGSPDLSLFPRAAWSAAQRRVLARLGHRALGYPDPCGLPALRRELAALLTRRRGVVVDPERLVVCSGVAQALSLLGMVLAARGHRTVAVERPGSPEHSALFAAVGLAAVPVELDAEGMAVERLAATGTRAAVLTPAHQFPSGIGCSPARRTALLEWARAGDGLLVEDDYDGDFRYDRQPVGALQGLDPARVAYTGSVSKSLAPGLRLGWLVPPPGMYAEVATRKRTLDLGNPVPDQAAFAQLLADGGYDRQLRRCQREYRQRRDALVAALHHRLPGAEVSGIAAGLHAIVTLPAAYGPTADLVDRAAAAGVAVRPLAAYGGGGGQDGGDGRVRLVLGYAQLAPARIAEGVRLLAGARDG